MFSVLLAFVFTGVLIYYSEEYDPALLDAFLPDRTGEEVQPVKPKIAPRKRHSSPREEFTFFETLSDPSLEKYVGLDGTMQGRGASAEKLKLLAAEKKKARGAPVRRQKAKTAGGLGTTALPLSAAAKTVKNGGNKFAVQASSFREFRRAARFLDKLKEKGYPAYMLQAEASPNKSVWYRVYLGKYPNRKKALEMVFKARVEERLNPLIVLQSE